MRRTAVGACFVPYGSAARLGLRSTRSLTGPLWPPSHFLGRPTTGQDKDDEDDLEQELDEFDAEELFEDEDITNRPQRSEPEVGSGDAAVMKEITDFNLSGEQYHKLGMWDEADQAFRDTLALIYETLGPHHPTAAVVLNNLAMVSRQKGNLEEAERLLQQALNLRRVHYGASHPRVALLLDHLGAIYRQQKRTDEALEVFRQSLAIIEEFDAKKLRTTHGGAAGLPTTAKAEVDEADALESDVNVVPVPAEASDTELRVVEDEDWEDLINLATAQNNLGLVYYQLEDYPKAEALFASAVAKAKRREQERAEMERRGEAGEQQAKPRPTTNPLASSPAVIQKNLALCFLKQGKLDQSERELRDVLDHLREEMGLREHDEPVVDAFRHLARVYSTMGKADESAFYTGKVARNEERKRAQKQLNLG